MPHAFAQRSQLSIAIGTHAFRWRGTRSVRRSKIVQRERELADTIFVGDGINDAPALMAATVGIAFGQNSDVTTEAAGVVILDSSLGKVDELLPISRRLPPVAGAIVQEVIDVVAGVNALRAAFPPKSLTDY